MRINAKQQTHSQEKGKKKSQMEVWQEEFSFFLSLNRVSILFEAVGEALTRIYIFLYKRVIISNFILSRNYYSSTVQRRNE